MGIAVFKDAALAKPFHNMMVNTGGVAGPMDCWLVLRGIKTLAVRMKQHLENAQKLAEYLQQHQSVAKVYYPGLSNHEHHELAKKQMRGFGGVVTIVLKNDSIEGANTFVRQLASSLGGVESLVNHCYSQSHSGMAHDVKMALGIREGLIRLSVGIEDIEDIIADVNQALEATNI